MNSIWNHFFLVILVLLATYSYGRYVSEWSTTNDLSLIDECLRKSVNRINKLQNTKARTSDASNIACITQFNNGINIRLTFQLEEQGWKCSLYKSLVQILPVQYEKCDQIDKADLPKPTVRQLESKNKNNGEDSDEAKIDRIHQNAQEKAEDHKQDNADMKDGNDHDKHSGSIEKNNEKELNDKDEKEAHNNNEDDDEPKPNLKNQENEHDDEDDVEAKPNLKNKQNGHNDEEGNDDSEQEEDDEPKSNFKNQQKENIDEEDSNEQALQELGGNDPEVEA